MLTRSTALVGFTLLLGFAGAAGAVSIGSGLGLDAGYACLPTATSCFAERDFDVSGTAAATGTIGLSGGPTVWSIDIALDVASLSMEDSVAAVDGVDKIVFSALTFDVTGWQGFDFTSSGTVTGAGTVLGSVTGSYEQFLGNTSVVGSAVFNEQVSFSNFICEASGVGQCGFEVGFINSPPGFPSLIQPVGTTAGGADHQFVWTFNVIIPEPSTATLLGLGLVGLASLRRRRA